MRTLMNAVRQLTPRPKLRSSSSRYLRFGIGITAPVFSLFQQALLEQLPVPKPEDVERAV